MRLQALAAMALPLLTCLIGCKVQTHAQIQGPDLQRQWSESIRRTGIQPIFPIREDVQVGDIYMSSIQSDEENESLNRRGHINLDLWMANLDITEEISKFYQTRLLFPETSSYKKTGGYLDKSYFGDHEEGGYDRRLARLVSFPAFASANINQDFSPAEIMNFVPPEIVNFFWMESRMEPRNISISASMAESYGLPVNVMHQSFAKQMRTNPDFQSAMIDNFPMTTGGSAVRIVRDQAAPYHKSVNYYVKLITEVYMVRSLDVVFGLARNKEYIDGLHTGIAGGMNLTRLNAMLAENVAANTSGGNIRFISIGPDSVGLRRTFARPIAVGYRGILLRVNGVDKSVEMVGPIDTKSDMLYPGGSDFATGHEAPHDFTTGYEAPHRITISVVPVSH